MDPLTTNRTSRPGGTTTPLSTGTRPLGSRPVALPRTTPQMPGLASAILVICQWLQNVAIGAWVGAILVLGILVAPHTVQAFKTPVASGQFLGPVMRIVTEAGGACALLYLVLLMVHDALLRRFHSNAANLLLSLLKTLLSAGMVATFGYLLYRVNGRMDHYLEVAKVVNGHLLGGPGRAFDYWHKLYEQIVQGLVGAGLLLMLLTQMSRRR